jgi:hypothetical protein
MRTAPVTATCYVGIYPGRADQVSLARRAVARHLAGCPVADDMIRIVSELASNAIMHSASQRQFFTVRAELYPDHVGSRSKTSAAPGAAGIATAARTAWTSLKRSPARMGGASRPPPTAGASSGRALTWRRGSEPAAHRAEDSATATKKKRPDDRAELLWR